MARTKKPLTVKATASSAPKKTTKPSVRAKRSTKGGDAKAASKASAPKTLKFRGEPSGMKVMEYQDHTLSVNHKTDHRLSDTKLADDWAKEFPRSECLQRRETRIVQGVRRLYNTGRHRSGVGIPARLSVPYDSQGQPIQGRQNKSKKSDSKAA